MLSALSSLLSRQRSISTGNSHFYAAVAALGLFLAGLVAVAHVGDLVRSGTSARHKQEAIANLTEAHARIEGLIGEAVATGRGIRSHVSAYPDVYMGQEHFSKVAGDLVHGNKFIKLVGLAPNNVVSAVYPVETNYKSVGMNYRLFADQWPSVREAMIRRSEVVSGPHKSRDGELVMMARVPVFQPTKPGQPLVEQRYWGVITVVVDEVSLIAAARKTDIADDYRIAIVAQNGKTSGPSYILGDPGLPFADSVSLPMTTFDGLHWSLVAYPVEGWRSHGQEIWITRIVGFFASAVFALMSYFLIFEVLKTRSMALHDPMTGLANRRLLEDRMSQLVTMYDRYGTGFDIFYLDLNDFKPINDTYGHAVGDQLLIEVGERLKDQTREMDTVARVGGDEFIVLAPGGMTIEHRFAFVERLATRINKPFKSASVEFAVKVSIGSASFPSDAATVEDLLRVADARMYTQKAKAHSSTSSTISRALLQVG